MVRIPRVHITFYIALLIISSFIQPNFGAAEAGIVVWHGTFACMRMWWMLIEWRAISNFILFRLLSSLHALPQQIADCLPQLRTSAESFQHYRLLEWLNPLNLLQCSPS